MHQKLAGGREAQRIGQEGHGVVPYGVWAQAAPVSRAWG